MGTRPSGASQVASGKPLLNPLARTSVVMGKDRTKMRHALRWAMIALAPLAMAACGSKPAPQADLDSLDAQLTNAAAPANGADPALTGALRDQIMVDPQLAQQANRDAVRPPTQPASGQVPPDDIATRTGAAETETLRSAPAAVRPGHCPQCVAAQQALTLGALAESQGGATGKCAKRVVYSAGWANRLPRGVPLYPDARVIEAAGADGQGCSLRVVSFNSAAPLQRLLDWYFTHTSAAGYSAAHQSDGQEHVLGGTRPNGGGAFMVTARPRAGGGTSVDLMADGG